MTYTEQLLAERDAKDTGWVDVVKAGAPGSFLILAPQIPVDLEKHLISQPVEYRQVDDTQRTTAVSTEANELALFTQLSRVYNYLSTGQIELDSEARKILYSNLWSMYE
jgi:hypothetical protein